MPKLYQFKPKHGAFFYTPRGVIETEIPRAMEAEYAGECRMPDDSYFSSVLHTRSKLDDRKKEFYGHRSPEEEKLIDEYLIGQISEDDPYLMTFLITPMAEWYELMEQLGDQSWRDTI